jgi:hypothetical protein
MKFGKEFLYKKLVKSELRENRPTVSESYFT